MEELNRSRSPEGLVLEAVEWLPSGGRSGLMRVRGRWDLPRADAAELPALLVDDGGTVHRLFSLPDASGEAAAEGWRASYVVSADLLEDAVSVAIGFSDGSIAPLPPPEAAVPADIEPEAAPEGGELIDRAVLADRRARRAEASLEAQAKATREALSAVEVLELRAQRLEEQLAAVAEERDALADQAASLAAPAEVEVLRRRVEEQAEVARALEAELAQVQERASATTDAALETERLRAALTGAVATIADLRASLREAHLARRTNDVERTAGAVRLAVAEAERDALAGRLAAALEEVRAAQAQTAEAERLVRGAEAAHDETRRRFTERVAELAQARERIAELEAGIATIRGEVEHEAAARLVEREAEMQSRLEALRAQTAERLAEMEARAAEERGEWESVEEELLARIAAAEEGLAGAETARLVAEAAAAAADTARRAAAVAHEARLAELERSVAPPRAPEPAAEPTAAEPVASEPVAPEPSAAEPVAPEPSAAEPAAPERAPLRLVDVPTIPAELLGPGDPLTPARAAVVADLDRAAEQLRGGEPPSAPEPSRTAIVPARTQLPRKVATGSGRRDYPPLRGALVKLAHDDPQAAAGVILGLAPAQWRCLERPLDYDLTIGDSPTHRIEVTAGNATVTPIAFPREYGEDYFHLQADAATVAEMIAGVVRFRRWGGPSVSGSRKAARALNAIGRAQLSLADVLRDGARLDPALVLRCLEYTIPLAWTRGHEFVVEERISGPQGEDVVYVCARDGRGVTVTTYAPDREPDATVAISGSAFAAMLRGEAPPAGERPVVRGAHAAVDALRDWAERVRTGSF